MRRLGLGQGLTFLRKLGVGLPRQQLLRLDPLLIGEQSRGGFRVGLFLRGDGLGSRGCVGLGLPET